MTGCKAACPICTVDVWWQSEGELAGHIRMCRRIEDGRLVEAIRTIELPDELLPSVEDKPPGWKWLG